MDMYQKRKIRAEKKNNDSQKYKYFISESESINKSLCEQSAVANVNKKISAEISNEIKKLPDNSEFNFQQFMINYDITDKEKFSISNLICSFIKISPL